MDAVACAFVGFQLTFWQLCLCDAWDCFGFPLAIATPVVFVFASSVIFPDDTDTCRIVGDVILGLDTYWASGVIDVDGVAVHVIGGVAGE